jgi:hypothetical protein
MPQLGETVTEGTITKWYKAIGDQVARDEPLFEVSTDKVDSEVPSPAEGVLTAILVAEGDTVDVGVTPGGDRGCRLAQRRRSGTGRGSLIRGASGWSGPRPRRGTGGPADFFGADRAHPVDRPTGQEWRLGRSSGVGSSGCHHTGSVPIGCDLTGRFHTA